LRGFDFLEGVRRAGSARSERSDVDMANRLKVVQSQIRERTTVVLARGREE
jgi:hypothetical protein